MSLVETAKAKLHCARVKQCDLHYSGSITIDADLLDAVGMVPMEFCNIWNKNNGERIQTYTIPGPRGSGMVCLNGAAARKFQYNDEIIVCSVRQVEDKLLADEDRRVAILDENNRVTRLFKYQLRDAGLTQWGTPAFDFAEVDIPFHYTDVGGKQRLSPL